MSDERPIPDTTIVGRPGFVALVLHCHLPYVHHPEHEDFLEEDWFYEAVAETYVPLLLMLRRLVRDEVPFRMAVSISPTLGEMMRNPLLQRRCVRYLARRADLASNEVRRTADGPFADAARMYDRHYRRVLEVYDTRWNRDLLGVVNELASAGVVELMASTATHALLPLVHPEAARRAQVAAGVAWFKARFSIKPSGFWLPECAYEPGIEELLAEFGIDHFVLDTHGILLAEPAPPCGVFAPLHTQAGPAAFGRDVESSQQVWSADLGYPGDAAYREFHRDLGHDADIDYLRPYLGPSGQRRSLGIKYHRVTGEVPLDRKKPYVPSLGTDRAREHARHFVGQRMRQLRQLSTVLERPPVVVAPYDAELFGHWWFEGPQFLEFVAREAANRRGFHWVTPGQALAELGAVQTGQPAFSTWGNGGYYDTWVNKSNDWMHPRLEGACRDMVSAAQRRPTAVGVQRRVLVQCARELLLAQSSDWPFLIATETAREYATQRFDRHLQRFRTLLQGLRSGRVDLGLLRECEGVDAVFPELDYRVFLSRQHASAD